ncbi:MAG: RNA 2',3'-cyclic phosphodiesterase [Burkholderiales bacterium]|nr:MAG: RNA 2',3'-cyclic phosphodiesterase [Burkholderiales bacterium]
MTRRLFIAIPVPEDISERLLMLEAEVAGASWRLPEHFHLTLRFIGDVDGAFARDIDHELGQIVAAPFEIALAGAGSFGGKEPSALWAGVDAPPDLARLASACERAVQRAGLPAEPRKYKPHVTLAYCNGTRDYDVANFLQDTSEFRTDRFWVDHFCMYSSRATKAGSRYVEEAVYPLVGTRAVP